MHRKSREVDGRDKGTQTCCDRQVDEPTRPIYVASRSFIAGEFSLNFKPCRAAGWSEFKQLRVIASNRYQWRFDAPRPPIFRRHKSPSPVRRCRLALVNRRLYKLIPHGVNAFAGSEITEQLLSRKVVTFYFRARTRDKFEAQALDIA